MHKKYYFYQAMGLTAALLSGVVYGVDIDPEVVRIMNAEEKPKVKIKPHPKPVKHHRAKRHRADAEPEQAAPAADASASPASDVIEPEMVAITGGCFQMGSPESEPERGSDEKQHQVCVENFEIGKYEVTQVQWQAVMGSNPSNFKGGNLPVEQVSWNDVQSFIEKLNAKTGKTYRLPTEAQWEYAARAGSTTAYSWGNTASHDYANYGKDECCDGLVSGKDQWLNTSPVGSFPSNAFGLHDMAGNVWEWTCSAYVNNYDGSEKTCVSNNYAGSVVIRGGSWNFTPWWLRSADRDGYDPTYRLYFLGFRISRIN